MTTSSDRTSAWRQRTRTRCRCLAFDSMRAWQRVFGQHPKGDYLDLGRDRGDVEARLNWYLPRSSVPVWSGQTPTFGPDAGTGPLALELLHQHENRVGQRPAGKAHRVYEGGPIGSALRVLRSPARVSLVGTSLHRDADGLGYLRLRKGFARDQSPVATSWPLAPLAADKPSWAVLAATGPSADTFDFTQCTSAGIRIICNSAVRNEALLSAFRPNIVCFGDPVFHFGPSKYAAAFREDLLRALDALPDLIAVVPEHYRGLLTAHIPAYAHRIQGQRLVGQPVQVPAALQGALTRRTGNVLTQHMIPVALQLGPRRVSLIGCDGRRPEERYFWAHGRAVQYTDDLMQSVFQAHPSFFKDVSYADYYAKHCAEVGRWVELAESRGAAIDVLTPSHIPVLASRLTSP